MEVRLATIKQVATVDVLVAPYRILVLSVNSSVSEEEVTDVDKQLVWGILTGTIISRMGRS